MEQQTECNLGHLNAAQAQVFREQPFSDATAWEIHEAEKRVITAQETLEEAALTTLTRNLRTDPRASSVELVPA